MREGRANAIMPNKSHPIKFEHDITHYILTAWLAFVIIID